MQKDGRNNIVHGSINPLSVIRHRMLGCMRVVSLIPWNLYRFHGGENAWRVKCFECRIGRSLWEPIVWVWNWNSTFKCTVVRSDSITSDPICVAFIYQSGTKGFAARWIHEMRGLQFARVYSIHPVFQSDTIDVLCQPHSYRHKWALRIAISSLEARGGLTAVQFHCG